MTFCKIFKWVLQNVLHIFHILSICRCVHFSRKNKQTNKKVICLNLYYETALSGTLLLLEYQKTLSNALRKSCIFTLVIEQFISITIKSFTKVIEVNELEKGFSITFTRMTLVTVYAWPDTSPLASALVAWRQLP